MKDTKSTHISFAFYDRANLETYLAEQAAQGWMIEQYSPNRLKFRRVAPGAYHFSIVYYHTPVVKTNLTAEQAEFLEYCARTGWYLVATERRMMILANQQEAPIPIETDPKMQLENIHRSVKKQHIRYMLMCLALSLLYFVMAYARGIVDLFTNTDSLHLLLVGIWYCTQGLPDMIGYYIWRRKAVVAAEEGVFYGKTASNAVFYVITSLAFVLSAGLVIVLGYGVSPVVTGVAFGMIAVAVLCGLWCLLRRLFSKLSPGKCRNVVTQTVTWFYIAVLVLQLFVMFHHITAHSLSSAADLPVSVTELTDADFADYYNRKYSTGTMLLTQEEYRQEAGTEDAGLPQLYYTITYVHADVLYDACLKDLRKDFARHGEAVTADAAVWMAEAAYQLYEHGAAQQEYLLCYDGYIVEIKFDWEPTAEQIVVVGQKLAQIER